MSNKTRRIWIKKFGLVPYDENNISYEIHHMDGNNKNDSIENLKCVSIEEHFQIHMKQEDWGAVALIGYKIGLGNKFKSDIQKGIKRPGVGGRKKGTMPINKGNTHFHSIEQKFKWSQLRKGKIHSIKIDKNIIKEIWEFYKDKTIDIEDIDRVGIVLRNGKILTYERAFAKHFSKIYDISSVYIYNLITKENIRIDV